MKRKTGKPTSKKTAGATEYGQLAVLATPGSSDPNIGSQFYQWRTYHGVVEGVLSEWVEKMGISAEEAGDILKVDPIVAAINHLAGDGWTLLYSDDVSPGKLTYDRCGESKPYVKARWWLKREGSTTESGAKRR